MRFGPRNWNGGSRMTQKYTIQYTFKRYVMASAPLVPLLHNHVHAIILYLLFLLVLVLPLFYKLTFSTMRHNITIQKNAILRKTTLDDKYCLGWMSQLSPLYWVSLCWVSQRHPAPISDVCWSAPSMPILPKISRVPWPETVAQWNRERKLTQKSGNPNWRGRLSTVDLLVLTNIDQVLLKLKTLFTFLLKQPILMRRSTALSLPLQ